MNPIVRKRIVQELPPFRLFATTSAGLEKILVSELKKIGAKQIAQAERGASFYGDLGIIYRANLWLRTAHRIMWELAEFDAPEREALYEGVSKIKWSDHMSLDDTLAVDAVSNRSEMDHTQFISRVVKDGIVDWFRKKHRKRPNVDAQSPSLKLNARILENRCTLSIDTSGERLHRRGYRPEFGTPAPLKETLAAGVLLLSQYDGEKPLVDPMCGSGTFLVEAALIAKKIAPGLLGRSFNFMNHPLYDKRIWKDCVEEAREQIRRDVDLNIFGSDISEEAIRAAKAAVLGASVDDVVRIKRCNIAKLEARSQSIIVTNPPYGERLGEMEQLASLYETIGTAFKQNFKGSTAHLLTASKYLAGKIGLKAKHRDTLFNGPLECRLLHYELY